MNTDRTFLESLFLKDFSYCFDLFLVKDFYFDGFYKYEFSADSF